MTVFVDVLASRSWKREDAQMSFDLFTGWPVQPPGNSIAARSRSRLQTNQH